MERGEWVVAYNGELYNYKYLKHALQKERQSFSTATDAEVFVTAIDTWGLEAALERADGMFALAALHLPSQRMYLVRDRMGEKPLYYARTAQGSLVFGSELPAVLGHPDVATGLDPVAVHQYFIFDYVPSPRTIVRSVKSLQPGHLLEFLGGRITRHGPYWEMPADMAPINRIDEAKNTLWESIRIGVRTRLTADVPVGVSLSGGLDSSAIAAAATEVAGRGHLPAFTLGFSDCDGDETPHAQAVAEHLGMPHYVEKVDSRSYLLALQHELDRLPEPHADTSYVPMVLLSKMAKEHVGVVLAGDGGDELLLGYPTFLAHRLALGAEKIPKALRRRVIQPLARQLPRSFDSWSFEYRVNRFIDGLDYDPFVRHFVWIGGTRPDVMGDLLEPAVANYDEVAAPLDVVSQVLRGYSSHEVLNRLSHMYARIYLADGVLQKVDRATMRHGLESRAPLLSEAVVTTALRISPDLRLRGSTGKHVLREALRSKLPDAIVRRSKHGFSVPLARWLNGALAEWVDEVLHPVRVRRYGVTKPEVVERLLREHRAGFRDHHKTIYALLVLQRWLERYC